jgi:RNA polymerase sigma-70 factor (ECF subfamily)
VQPADIEDIRQEVFQAVTVSIGTFRRDRPGDTFRGWLRVITRRKFLDLCRRQGGQPTAEGGSEARWRLLQIPEAAAPDTDDSPEEIKGLHLRALELVRAGFEERTWQLFWLSAVEGRAPANIAQDFHVTPAAVRQAKSRVLRRLKEEFGELLG